MWSSPDLDEVDELGLVVGEAEEVVFFGDGFGGLAVGADGAGRAFDEHLFADAVLAGVGAEVDGAAVVRGLRRVSGRRACGGVGGADVVVVGDAHALPEVAEGGGDLVGELLGGMPAAAAERSIFWPCSSVPVRKKVSSPRRRWRRAMTSAAMVV